MGGSLYDLPDLGSRLRSWLSALACSPVLLVPGGGPTADAVRTLDRQHLLGDLIAHDLALRGLTLNAWFLSSLLRAASRQQDAPHGFPVINALAVWPEEVCILDAHAFCDADAANPGSLPASWDVTSDSVAARAAVVLGAAELILLKSIPLPRPCDWAEAGRCGWVDPLFATVLAGSALAVRAVNFRSAEGMRD